MRAYYELMRVLLMWKSGWALVRDLFPNVDRRRSWCEFGRMNAAAAMSPLVCPLMAPHILLQWFISWADPEVLWGSSYLLGEGVFSGGKVVSNHEETLSVFGARSAVNEGVDSGVVSSLGGLGSLSVVLSGDNEVLGYVGFNFFLTGSAVVTTAYLVVLIQFSSSYVRLVGLGGSFRAT